MVVFTNVIKHCFLGSLIVTTVICFVVIFKIKRLQYDLAYRYSAPRQYSSTTHSVNGTVSQQLNVVTVSTPPLQQLRTSQSINLTVSPQPDTSILQLCPEKPPNISIPTQIDHSNITLKELRKKYSASDEWGRFKPQGCRSRVRLAIVIPYRDREEHLCKVLNNLIPFLNMQQADFNIYIVEQTQGDIFNRGLLINAGVREALKRDNFTCIIIHDVDLIPETSDNYYRCQNNPVHMSTANGKYGYKLPYPSYSGGIIAVAPEQFRKVNGFSNWYFGWGGEDDDFHIRLKRVGMRLLRNPSKQGRYYAIKHKRDKLNPENPKKGMLYRSSRTRMKTEGLSSLMCNQTVTANGTFTWLHISIDHEYYNKTMKL